MELIPDKINERPSVWLGLTMGEITRTGLCFAVIAFLLGVLPVVLVFRTIPSFLFGMLGAIVITAGGIYFSGKVIAKRKAGKPYGFSDQRFARKMASLGLKKIPCVVRTGVWSYKR